MKLMIIDGDGESRKKLAQEIENLKAGITEIIHFESGEEALAYLQTEIPRLIFTEVDLDDMPGTEVLRFAKNLTEECFVVLMSGKREFDLLMAGGELGMDGYLLKPFQVEKIQKLIFRLTYKIEEDQRNKDNHLLVEEYDKYQIIKHIIQKKLTEPTDIEIFLKQRCRLGKIEVLFGAVIQDDKINYRLDTEDMIRNVVSRKISEYLSGYQYSVFLMSGDEVFILVNVPDSTLRIYHLRVQMSQLAGAINKEIRNGSVSIGSGGTGFKQDIPKLYNQAEAALEYRYCYGNGRHLEYHTCREEEQRKQNLQAAQLHERILSQIQGGDEKGLQRELEKCKVGLFGLKKEMIQEFILRNMMLAAGSDYKDYQDKLRHSILDQNTFDETFLLWVEFLFRIQKERNEKQNYGITVSKGIEYIEAHYMETITVEEVADYLEVSAGHFSRIFKKQTGKTFVKYLNQYRIDIAEKYIRNTNYKLYEIAELTGFQDYRYFTQIFHKLKNRSPSELRRCQNS